MARRDYLRVRFTEVQIQRLREVAHRRNEPLARTIRNLAMSRRDVKPLPRVKMRNSPPKVELTDRDIDVLGDLAAKCNVPLSTYIRCAATEALDNLDAEGL